MEETKDIHKVVETIGKALPLGYAFLVFCGALYVEFYYNTFHIDIFRYLDISEIAVSFLPIFLTIAFNSVFIIVIFLISTLFNKQRKSWKVKSKSFIRKYEVIATIIFGVFCALYLYLSYDILNKTSVLFDFQQGKISTTIGWFFFYISIPFIVIILSTNNKYRLSILIIMFIMSIVHRSIGDVQETIQNPYYYYREARYYSHYLYPLFCWNYKSLYFSL